MNKIHTWLHGRWAVPAISGVAIVASLIADKLGATTVGNILMLAAAVVAGLPIAIKAFRSLMVKHISIDLLVSVAAIGAILVGNFWEAAAVTFLFAVGGVVIGGNGAINEASITGESIPAEKSDGDQVFAGTISTGGFLQVEARGVGADTTLARIIHRVEEAQDAKAKTQKFMDRFSKWYTPGIMVLALVVGLITRDVTLALTLLVIGCPGALVISIPVSIVAGIGRGARDGILIKGGEFLETSAKITAVALDKTGTLTEGKPKLTDVVVLDPSLSADELLTIAARA
jgi:Cd2+/Zn2+-exporting ATPase